VLGLAWFVVFLFSLTVHEAAHAWAALKLGDSTAYQGGQVTLNPIPHMRREPFGTLVVPLLSYFLLGGWMMGWASAPYDPYWAQRYPRRAGWMALAGPVANLIIAVVAAVAMRVGLASGFFENPEGLAYTQLVSAGSSSVAEPLAVLASILFSLNVLLFLFNLLPVPPLDGSSILQLFLPEDTARRYQAFVSQPMMGLLGLVIAWRLFGEIFGPIFGVFLSLIYGF